MPRSSFQKLKIIYIMEYLLKNSDEDHAVTTSQIIAYLKSHDITAERKTIYSDIDALRDFGLDIIQVSEGNNHGYYVASRDFELPELKLLVDSVQSSKFITHKKTLSLIKKIEKLASIHSAQLLNRQVFVKNRIKTMNESIYYNVDEIHNGISSNRKIRFLYFEYNVAKERVYRHGGAYYVVSPFAMTWDDENYYMVAFDSAAGIIKHYRVDKMERSPFWMKNEMVRTLTRRSIWPSMRVRHSACSPARRSRFISVSKIISWAPYSTVSGGM